MTILQAAQGSKELDACFAIRMQVFVTEQNVPPEEELDELDAISLHFLALWNGTPAGTARCFEKSPGIWKIGRVAVLADYRQHKIGAGLMRAAEAACPTAQAFVLTAQCQALQFYKKLGYVAEGPEFLEAGIPHRFMRKVTSAG